MNDSHSKYVEWPLFSVLLFLLVSPSSLVSQTANRASEEQYASEGQEALAAGQYAVARTAFEKIARLDPGVAEVHGTLAVIDFKIGDFGQAVSEARTAKRLKPELPKLDGLIGMSLVELGQYKEALPGLEKGFQSKSDTETRRLCGLHLMRAYTELHRDSDAVDVAQQLHRLYPDDPEVLYHTGRVYGNFAFLIMNKLDAVAPTSIWRHQAAAEALESAGSTDASIGEYREVLKLEPNHLKIHYRIGRTLLARFQLNHAPEDRAQAAQEFEQELQLDPTNANALYELGEIHRQSNDLERAEQLFEAALKYYPEFQEAQVGLAATLLAEHKPDSALLHLKRAVELNADDEVAWYRLAQTERALGNTEEQKKALFRFRSLRGQTAVQQETGNPGEVTRQVLKDGEVQ